MNKPRTLASGLRVAPRLRTYLFDPRIKLFGLWLLLLLMHRGVFLNFGWHGPAELGRELSLASPSDGEAKVSFFFTSLLVGLRFDLMVAAYLVLPHLAEDLLASLLPHQIKRGHQFVFSGLCLCVVLLTSWDLQLWLSQGRRFSAESLDSFGSLATLPLWTSLVGVLILLFLSALQWRVFTRWISPEMNPLSPSSIPAYTNNIRPQRTSCWRRWLFCFVILLICARGSFSDLHLDLRHAILHDSTPGWNEWVIPSPYALDQGLRHRR